MCAMGGRRTKGDIRSRQHFEDSQLQGMVGMVGDEGEELQAEKSFRLQNKHRGHRVNLAPKISKENKRASGRNAKKIIDTFQRRPSKMGSLVRRISISLGFDLGIPLLLL